MYVYTCCVGLRLKQPTYVHKNFRRSPEPRKCQPLTTLGAMSQSRKVWRPVKKGNTSQGTRIKSMRCAVRSNLAGCARRNPTYAMPRQYAKPVCTPPLEAGNTPAMGVHVAVQMCCSGEEAGCRPDMQGMIANQKQNLFHKAGAGVHALQHANCSMLPEAANAQPRLQETNTTPGGGCCYCVQSSCCCNNS
jgi:hypothetical protein